MFPGEIEQPFGALCRCREIHTVSPFFIRLNSQGIRVEMLSFNAHVFIVWLHQQDLRRALEILLPPNRKSGSVDILVVSRQWDCCGVDQLAGATVSQKLPQARNHLVLDQVLAFFVFQSQGMPASQRHSSIFAIDFPRHFANRTGETAFVRQIGRHLSGCCVFAKAGFGHDQELQLSSLHQSIPNLVSFRFAIGWNRDLNFVCTQWADHDFLGTRRIDSSQQNRDDLFGRRLCPLKWIGIFVFGQVEGADHVDPAP